MSLSFVIDRNALGVINLFMPNEIKDEFTGLKRKDGLPASRQYLAQLRRKRDRKCTICGRPAKTKWHCPMHAKLHAKLSKKTYHEVTKKKVKEASVVCLTTP